MPNSGLPSTKNIMELKEQIQPRGCEDDLGAEVCIIQKEAGKAWGRKQIS